MKVVLFCGGQGTRLRDYSDAIPKPMVNIGYRPVLWHVMKYYAHYGHTDFILCLGYKADVIKRYFLGYDECMSNDFVLSDGGQRVELLNHDIQNWRITFVDTGANSNIGERLKLVEPHLEGEDVFLANYSDGLTDCPLPTMIEHFEGHDCVASFLCVRPAHTYHLVKLAADSTVDDIQHVEKSDTWINGGYFVLRKDIFRYMRQGDELVLDPFQRLIRERKLVAYQHRGFWMSMDTFKDKQRLDDLYAASNAPWEVWKGSPDDDRPGRHGGTLELRRVPSANGGFETVSANGHRQTR